MNIITIITIIIIIVIIMIIIIINNFFIIHIAIAIIMHRQCLPLDYDRLSASYVRLIHSFNILNEEFF